MPLYLGTRHLALTGVIGERVLVPFDKGDPIRLPALAGYASPERCKLWKGAPIFLRDLAPQN